MSLLKKRSTAICVFVIVVIAFTLIGSHLSLTRACEKAEAAFFDKSLLQSDDYHTCPGDQLEYCVDYANRLLSVIGTEGAWAGPYASLRTARLDLIDALDARDIPAIGRANQALTEAVQDVEATAAGGAAMPDSYDDYDTIVSEFHSAQSVLDDGAYNDYILSFRDKVLAPFPASILRHLTGVKAPETFP